MKYLVIAKLELDSPEVHDVFIKEFKTYEKAKPYFEEQKSRLDLRGLYLVDVLEENK